MLDLLEGVRPGTDGYTALCPAHGDNRSSLSIAEGDDGKVLLKCFAGCNTEEIVEALDLDMADLFPRDPTKPTAKTPNGAGLTLLEYAEDKILPIKFLQELGITQIYLEGAPAVRMPYMDIHGSVLSTRMRVSMEGERRFVWKTGSKTCLYGLRRLSKYSGCEYICLAEGESCTQTLWLHNFPALGLPGADCWNEDWATHFDCFQRIYAIIEPDRGGQSVEKWLAKSKLRDRVRLIKLREVKDASGLYLADPENFTSAWKAAMKAAVPWKEIEDGDRKARMKEAWVKCKRLAQMEDILEEFLEDLERQGVAGERRTAGIIFLSLISRFLKRPDLWSRLVRLLLESPLLLKKPSPFFRPAVFMHSPQCRSGRSHIRR